MRVIGGFAKGRRLFTPKDSAIRPTADRVKESLFNILSVQLGSFEGLRVLDIFAGTGNLGIEALSRGASEAVFVEENRGAALLIRKNLDLTGFALRSSIIQRNALTAIPVIAKTPGSFGLVFLDPPYRLGLAGGVMELLGDTALVDVDSIVVVETAAREELAYSYGMLETFDTRTYGDTAIRFFQLRP